MTNFEKEYQRKESIIERVAMGVDINGYITVMPFKHRKLAIIAEMPSPDDSIAEDAALTREIYETMTQSCDDPDVFNSVLLDIRDNYPGGIDAFYDFIEKSKGTQRIDWDVNCNNSRFGLIDD